jgi:hypothetical protein
MPREATPSRVVIATQTSPIPYRLPIRRNRAECTCSRGRPHQPSLSTPRENKSESNGTRGGRREQSFARRRRGAAAVAAVSVAVASLGTVAHGSSSASGREGRSTSIDLANALAAARDGNVVVAGLSNKGEGDFALA